ncbi:MAG: hypothetical protein PHV23_05975 [Candidatus Gracilibacteria bacterium]|nr:hypothetical protein [Candidatus Gracilibacteria bacterium]
MTEIQGKNKEQVSAVETQASIDKSSLTPEQLKVYERIEELKKTLETVNAQEKFSRRGADILRKGLTSDSSIKNDPEAKPTIDMYNRYLARFNEAVKKGGDIKAELSLLESDVTKSTDKLEFSAGIDEKGEKLKYDTEKLKTISSKDFLSLPENERLQYVTKDNVDCDTISSGSVKDITFSFDQDGDGQLNKELYMLTTAGQVLPKEVREVTKDGEKYIRVGLKGEFYNGEKRLTIHDKTNISVDKLGTPDELNNLEQENLKKYNEFIEKNSEFKDEKYTQTLKEAFSKGIKSENELKFLLTGNVKNLEKSSPSDLDNLLVISMYLKNGGFLDDYADAGEIISNLTDIINTVNKYGKKLKYSVGENGDIKFNLNDNGLPEGLEGMEMGLEKISQIALSQLGTSEKNGGADKYLKDLGYNNLNSRNTPWCAAFVNWTLMQAGYKGTGGLSAKEFIGESGYGHVGIKLGDKLLGGNQGNKVSLMNINKQISGYAIPTSEGLKVIKPAGNKNTIPDGAIVVFDRNTKRDRNFA